MRRARGVRGFRGRRRAVNWIDGFSGYDSTVPQFSRTLTLVNVSAANIFGAAVQLVNATDLAAHGGEGAVCIRIRGRILLYNSMVDSGAGLLASAFPVRVVISQATTVGAATLAEPFPNSNGMGSDTIMWSYDTLTVSAAGFTEPAASIHTATWKPEFIDVDVKAKRRMTNSKLPSFWLQTVLPVGTVSATVRMAGGLRTLVQRPR